jgi:hypothetical protein
LNPLSKNVELLMGVWSNFIQQLEHHFALVTRGLHQRLWQRQCSLVSELEYP